MAKTRKENDIMEMTYDTKINIQNEANFTAKGEHTNGNAIPIVCVTTGEVYTSIIDAAKEADTHANYMSKRLREEDMPIIKGNRYCYLSRLMESANMVLTCLRDTNKEVELRKADEDDARKWREYEAEQERIRKEEEARIEAERKAKEEYETKKQKLEAKIQRRREISERMKQGWNDALARQMETELEYEVLTGHAFDSEETA